jgi:broad specificity phosphatase PhoE
MVQGWIGSELTENGHKQAKEFAENFSEIPQAIFYSDLNRTKQTVAALIEKFPNVPVFPDWRLRERSFGKLEGDHRDSVDWDIFYNTPPDESPSGAEPEAHLQERVKAFMRDVGLLNISHAVVVTHGGVLNRFKFILEPNHVKTKFANTGAFDIEYSFDDPRLKPGPIPKWSYKCLVRK